MFHTGVLSTMSRTKHAFRQDHSSVTCAPPMPTSSECFCSGPSPRAAKAKPGIENRAEQTSFAKSIDFNQRLGKMGSFMSEKQMNQKAQPFKSIISFPWG